MVTQTVHLHGQRRPAGVRSPVRQSGCWRRSVVREPLLALRARRPGPPARRTKCRPSGRSRIPLIVAIPTLVGSANSAASAACLTTVAIHPPPARMGITSRLLQPPRLPHYLNCRLATVATAGLYSEAARA